MVVLVGGCWSGGSRRGGGAVGVGLLGWWLYL